MLSAKGFGITCGIMWALYVAWSVIVAMLGIGTAPFDVVDQFYFGWLSPNVTGLVIGIVIAFIDGLIGGAVFAWIYNAIGGKKAAA